MSVSPGSTGVGSDLFDEFSGGDRWEVAICRIPDDSTDPTYVTTAERLGIGTDEIVRRLAGVTDYFSRWSHGRYLIEWAAVADVTIESDEDSYDCVERVVAASADDTAGVLVIADAQHDEGTPGGWGRRGDRCDRPCSVRESGRAAYVGASDFMSYWGADSPLDLIEHEIGHALGWPHSATVRPIEGEHVYDSAVDVMSNSAAPRDVDPARRHAPGVLAVNAWAAGWLDDDEIRLVRVQDRRVGEWSDAIRVVASDSTPDASRVRLVVIDSGDELFTVELLAARGDNDHLPSSGVVVHEIEFDERAPDGRWHVVRSSSSSGTPIVGSGSTWVSPEEGFSIRLGAISTSDDGVVSVDVRVRRDAPSATG